MAEQPASNRSIPTPCYATWRPAWHELDQTLILDLRQRYFFFPSSMSSQQDDSEPALVFFNGVDPAIEGEVRFAKVVKIEHKDLGELLRVDTFGLDYILYPCSGEEIVVDADEEPGIVRSGSGPVEDWSLRVTLTEISDAISPQGLA